MNRTISKLQRIGERNPKIPSDFAIDLLESFKRFHKETARFPVPVPSFVKSTREGGIDLVWWKERIYCVCEDGQVSIFQFAAESSTILYRCDFEQDPSEFSNIYNAIGECIARETPVVDQETEEEENSE